jgi:hypothetical protein
MRRIDAATTWSLGLWLVFGLTPTVVFSVEWPKLMDQNAAAWVQAVGSVAAILVAIFISHDQQRRDTKRRSAERAEPIEMRAALLVHAGMTLNKLIANLVAEPLVGLRPPDVREFEALLRRFEDYADPILVISTSELTHHTEIPTWSTAKDSIRAAKAILDGSNNEFTISQYNSLFNGAGALMNAARVLSDLAESQRKSNG